MCVYWGMGVWGGGGEDSEVKISHKLVEHILDHW